MLHRDLKPANIFVTKRGPAKILDFGLTKAIDVSTDLPCAADGLATGAGTVVGTIGYMSQLARLFETASGGGATGADGVDDLVRAESCALSQGHGWDGPNNTRSGTQLDNDPPSTPVQCRQACRRAAATSFE